MSPHISDALKQRYVTELYPLFQKAVSDKTIFKQLLQDLLSPAEYRELLIRWQILKELHRGTSQREIAKKLHVSISQVTRGSRVLAEPRSPLKTFLNTTR